MEHSRFKIKKIIPFLLNLFYFALDFFRFMTPHQKVSCYTLVVQLDI